MVAELDMIHQFQTIVVMNQRRRKNQVMEVKIQTGPIDQ